MVLRMLLHDCEVRKRTRSSQGKGAIGLSPGHFLGKGRKRRGDWRTWPGRNKLLPTAPEAVASWSGSQDGIAEVMGSVGCIFTIPSLQIPLVHLLQDFLKSVRERGR
jgi:hypothetical protein